MSQTDYQLAAWTENGEVHFSGPTMQEQEMLLQDEFDSLYFSDMSVERYLRLCFIAWELGMFLLKKQDYSGAYSRFVDGIYICRDAIRSIPAPRDGGVNPFRLAMEDLYKGCRIAALEEGYTLEEVFYEDGILEYARAELRDLDAP